MMYHHREHCVETKWKIYNFLPDLPKMLYVAHNRAVFACMTIKLEFHGYLLIKEYQNIVMQNSRKFKIWLFKNCKFWKNKNVSQSSYQPVTVNFRERSSCNLTQKFTVYRTKLIVEKRVTDLEWHTMIRVLSVRWLERPGINRQCPL